MVAACEAGKDVYVEKPMANSIGELDVMVQAARKNNRVVQVGQQQRSGSHWKEVMDFIKAGNIGQLRKTRIWGNFGYGVGQPVVPDSAPPEHVDFDMWLGPAPDRSFNASRFHGSWRMFWDYGGGLMTDWGVHLIDMGLWAKDVTYDPVSAMAPGGNYSHKDRAHETYDTMSVSWQMKDHVMTWDHCAGIESGPYNKSYGVEFIGNDATLVVNRQGWALNPEVENGEYKIPARPDKGGREYHEEHVKNFLECIKTRKDPNCPVETGRLVALYAHMGNIALRTQSHLRWDESRKDFGNNELANDLIYPEYRKPWKFPRI
jgi:predicted dehydrogenase